MNIKNRIVTISLWLIYYFQETSCFDPITIGAGAVFTIGSIYSGFKYLAKCQNNECCQHEKWIKKDMQVLKLSMNQRLFGQHIAQTTVLSAITSHINNEEPKKALTMSFHGLPGSGKNYLSSMIANSYFLKGENSKYYHFFNGRTEFTNDEYIDVYKLSIKSKIIDSLKECPYSIFVFDEVDMMPQGVLNVLVPFLQYGIYQDIYDIDHHVSVKTNNAIYIFLSNTGSHEIINTLIKIWENGGNRDETKLSDFENLITIGAFNEVGGFKNSHTISTNLIDHYVPFLPMEEKHVKLCIEAEFKERNYKPSDDDINEVMSYVTFDPSTHNLFAKSGCKRLSLKIATIIYQKREKFL